MSTPRFSIFHDADGDRWIGYKTINDEIVGLDFYQGRAEDTYAVTALMENLMEKARNEKLLRLYQYVRENFKDPKLLTPISREEAMAHACEFYVIAVTL